jgi:hypothetical protein
MAASIEVSSLIGRVPSLSMAFIGRVAVKEMGYATLIARPVTFRDDLLNYVFSCHGRNGSDKSIGCLYMRATVLDDIEPIGRNHSRAEQN